MKLRQYSSLIPGTSTRLKQATLGWSDPSSCESYFLLSANSSSGTGLEEEHESVFWTTDNELKERLAFIKVEPCKLNDSSFQSPVLPLPMKNQDNHATESNRTLLNEVHLPDLRQIPQYLNSAIHLGNFLACHHDQSSYGISCTLFRLFVQTACFGVVVFLFGVCVCGCFFVVFLFL